MFSPEVSRWDVKAATTSLMSLQRGLVPTPLSEMKPISPPSSRSCRVICGPNDSYFEIAGKSIASVRRALRTPFNISESAAAILNGVGVDEDHRLQSGDHLTFLQQWGWKSGSPSDSPFHPGDPCPFLLTEAEAIRYLRLDTIDIANPDDTLRRYRSMGLLRGTQVSKRVFYLRVELDLLLTRLTEQNPR